jgi:hypothetical protein
MWRRVDNCITRCFGGKYRLHLQGRRKKMWKNAHAGSSLADFFLLPWRWRRYVLTKRRFIQYLHGATSQKAALICTVAYEKPLYSQHHSSYGCCLCYSIWPETLLTVHAWCSHTTNEKGSSGSRSPREFEAGGVPYSSTATNLAQEEYGNINTCWRGVDHVRHSHLMEKQEF